MAHVQRLGVVVVALAGIYGASCSVQRGGTDAPRAPSPAVPVPIVATAGDAGPEAGAADEPELTAFTSKEDLLAYLREARVLPRPTPAAIPATAGTSSGEQATGNMWGDAIGDAFGAGGLGLSGVGEGGGGQGQGIGLGSVGTLGNGSGTGSGYGVGSSSSRASTSVTNTQHAGVDEGGIVKVRGEHLVVLRRGRLFTVRLGDLTPVSAVDAFGAGIDPLGAWYDELLVTNDTIVVIGYSYARGGTEIGLFDLDAAGHITSRATYHMRADDYYSSRNYASRLVGNKLVFYSPLYVRPDQDDALRWMPAVRRWKPGATKSEFSTIIEPSQIVRPLDKPVSSADALALHTVTTCELGAAHGGMTCSARAVMGPPGRVFYVSPDAVYVWMTPWAGRRGERAKDGPAASLLYRLPLDPKESARVLRTRGAPIDQFSFLERDGYLNVVVRASSSGEAMWSPEVTAGAIGLMRVPVTSFGARVAAVPSSAYTTLPEARGAALHNRFVGDHLLYGVGSGWGRPSKPTDARVFVHRYAGSGATTELAVAHGIDRIEPMGSDAIVVGSDGADLTFTSIALDGRAAPSVGGKYTRKGASQGELRSHGFFYRDDGDRSGIVGLPVRGGSTPGYRHLVDGSASVLYLRHDGLRFREMGTLGAKGGAPSDDRCRTSCIDWYGNARPLFVADRVLALMGYEVVEGKLDAGGKLSVEKRASFAPR